MFWCLIGVIVWQWDAISAAYKQMCPARAPPPPVTSSLSNAASSGAEPLLTIINKEVNKGETPEYPHDRRVFELFGDIVKNTPGAPALVLPGPAGSGSHKISYQELSEAIEDVAEKLNSVGVANGEVAALILDRSVGQVIAVW